MHNSIFSLSNIDKFSSFFTPASNCSPYFRISLPFILLIRKILHSSRGKNAFHIFSLPPTKQKRKKKSNRKQKMCVCNVRWMHVKNDDDHRQSAASKKEQKGSKQNQDTRSSKNRVSQTKPKPLIGRGEGGKGLGSSLSGSVEWKQTFGRGGNAK